MDMMPIVLVAIYPLLKANFTWIRADRRIRDLSDLRFGFKAGHRVYTDNIQKPYRSDIGLRSP